jgi:hypothetical protein
MIKASISSMIKAHTIPQPQISDTHQFVQVCFTLMIFSYDSMDAARTGHGVSVIHSHQPDMYEVQQLSISPILNTVFCYCKSSTFYLNYIYIHTKRCFFYCADLADQKYDTYYYFEPELRGKWSHHDCYQE